MKCNHKWVRTGGDATRDFLTCKNGSCGAVKIVSKNKVVGLPRNHRLVNRHAFR